jgi:hypothetical protein
MGQWSGVAVWPLGGGGEDLAKLLLQTLSMQFGLLTMDVNESVIEPAYANVGHTYSLHSQHGQTAQVGRVGIMQQQAAEVSKLATWHSSAGKGHGCLASRQHSRCVTQIPLMPEGVDLLVPEQRLLISRGFAAWTLYWEAFVRARVAAAMMIESQVLASRPLG